MRAADALAALVLTSAATSAADVPFLAKPIDCTLGQTCFIQNYVDRAAGPDAQDFMCHGLTYDGHAGTDFALPSLAAMEDGVAVLAAAPGTVLARRDGEPDTGLAGATAGKECGNGVVIGHGGGWQTQYCHLQQGTVAVIKGQRVATGTALGLVGLSGRTEFPHVHISLRRNGAVIDPFDTGESAVCGADGDTLWRDAPAYRPGGLIAAGFADRVPAYAAVKTGLPNRDRFAPDDAALVLWGYAFGGRKGDQLRLVITGPDGLFSDQTLTLEKAQAQFFRASGRKLHQQNRTPGVYRGQVTLIRDGQDISRQDVTAQLDP